MSRLETLSPTAIKAMFSVETDQTFVRLLTIFGSNLTEPIRLADNFNTRILETEDDIIYGVVSRTQAFAFNPFILNLPDESQSVTPEIQVKLLDVNGSVRAKCRSLTTPPTVELEVVLMSNTDSVEMQFPSFTLSAFEYDDVYVTATISFESQDSEPIPAYIFTPADFPGLF